MAQPYRGDYDRGRVERQDFRDHRDVRKVQVKKVTYRHFRKGERFDHRSARNYREIRNPRSYGFRAAPYGHRWVQSDQDALLVSITTGLVAAVIANAL